MEQAKQPFLPRLQRRTFALAPKPCVFVAFGDELEFSAQCGLTVAPPAVVLESAQQEAKQQGEEQHGVEGKNREG